MTNLKLVKKEQQYTPRELARIYPGFHYAFELFKTLDYNAEKDIFTAKEPLPGRRECMNSLADLYGVETSDFKDLLNGLLSELLSLMNPEPGNRKDSTNNIGIINEAMELLNGIEFQESTDGLIVETQRMSRNNRSALLYNTAYALELIKQYYSDKQLPPGAAKLSLDNQLDELIDKLSQINLEKEFS